MTKRKKGYGLTLTVITSKSDELRKKLIDSGCNFEEISSPAIRGVKFFKVYNYNRLKTETAGSLCDFCDSLNGIKKHDHK